MGWTDVDLTGVSTDMETIPEGQYVFELLAGAKYSQIDAQKIEAGAKIVEGEYAGRVQYFSYGNPEKAPSMIGAFKRLESALAKNTGLSADAGEDPVSYLNNDQVVGGRFIAAIKHRTYENKDGESIKKSDLSVFKVRPIPGA